MGTLDYAKEQPYLDKITALYDEHFRTTDEARRKEIYAEINRVAQEGAQYAVPNEIDKLYKAMGGDAVNAHTWQEETVYKVSLPMNRIEQWAIIESERFREPIFRLFHTELETVYEEKNRSLDDKDRLISEAVAAALFKHHPYGQQTTIGTVEHLKNPNLKYIHDYFDRWYVPNNMAVFISGNIDADETMQVIDKYFSSWERKDLPPLAKYEEDPIEGPESVTVKYKAEPYVMLAFRTAAVNDADADALKLLDMILDNSVAGLINLNLNQAQLVREAGSYPFLFNDYGAQYLWGVPKEGQTLDEVEQLLLQQIEIIKDGKFDDWVLPAIVTDFKKNRKAGLESDFARVDTMRSSYIAFTDWDRAVDEIARMEKLRKRDIVRVANKYFNGGYISGRRLDEQQDIPSIVKPQIDAVTIDPTRQSEFAKKILAMPVEPIEPVFVNPDTDYKVAEYPQGVKLYYSPNPLNDLFSLSILVEFGTFEDNKIGVSTALLDKSGTERYSAEDLKKEWYKLGMDASVSSGDNETFIQITGLDENFEKSLSLLLEWIREPRTDDETLETLKQIILVSREDEKKDPGSLGRALSQYNRYGDESSFLRRLSSEEVQKLTADELFAVIRGLLDYKHVITYTGSLPLEEMKSVLDRLHPLPDTLKDPPPYRFLHARQPSQSEILFLNKEMAQAQVRLEYASGQYEKDILLPAEMYNNYFAGGMSGIVFQELREARALAYSVGALYHVGTRISDENIMIGAIGCQADKTPEAVAAFIDLMDNLPESPERMQEAIRSMDNQYRTSKLSFREVIGAVRAWEKLGLAPDPRKEQFEALQHAGLDTVTAFHDQHVEGRPKLISIVGDQSRIDLNALKEFGTVTEVGLTDLFVD
jgi:predicted Zn-dependent peptidase